VISGGLLEAPLYPLKPGVSRGPSGLSGGPGPLGSPHNSTTACTVSDKQQLIGRISWQYLYQTCIWVPYCILWLLLQLFFCHCHVL